MSEPQKIEKLVGQNRDRRKLNEDIRILTVKNWRSQAQDRDVSRKLVMNGLSCQK